MLLGTQGIATKSKKLMEPRTASRAGEPSVARRRPCAGCPAGGGAGDGGAAAVGAAGGESRVEESQRCRVDLRDFYCNFPPGRGFTIQAFSFRSRVYIN